MDRAGSRPGPWDKRGEESGRDSELLLLLADNH